MHQSLFTSLSCCHASSWFSDTYWHMILKYLYIVVSSHTNSLYHAFIYTQKCMCTFSLFPLWGVGHVLVNMYSHFFTLRLSPTWLSLCTVYSYATLQPCYSIVILPNSCNFPTSYYKYLSVNMFVLIVRYNYVILFINSWDMHVCSCISYCNKHSSYYMEECSNVLSMLLQQGMEVC